MCHAPLAFASKEMSMEIKPEDELSNEKSQAGLQITGEGDGLPEAKRTDKRGGCFTVR